MSLSRETIEELRARQIAFVQNRLVSGEAQGEWRVLLEEVHAELLGRKFAKLFSADAVNRLADSILDHPSFEKALVTVGERIRSHLAAELKADPTTVGDYVPTEARAGIDALLERPDMVPEKLIRKLIEQDAMEEAMRDVLYDAIRTFDENVNPFFAEWGLPALIKRFMPIGSGAVIKAMEAVRGEFDKRLEPEIRKFLQGFSRKALGKLADFLVAKANGPGGVAFRKSMVAWVYSQELRQLAARIENRDSDRARTIAAQIASHVARMEAVKTRRRKLVSDFFDRHKGRTLTEVLSQHGIEPTPDFDAIAAASWPLLKASLESKAARQLIAKIISEFYDSIS